MDKLQVLVRELPENTHHSCGRVGCNNKATYRFTELHPDGSKRGSWNTCRLHHADEVNNEGYDFLVDNSSETA